MVVEALSLREGSDIEIQVENNALVIRPGGPVYTLEELVEKAKHQTPPDPLDDGPVGSEFV